MTDEIKAMEQALFNLRVELQAAQRRGSYHRAGQLAYGEIPELERKIKEAQEAAQETAKPKPVPFDQIGKAKVSLNDFFMMPRLPVRCRCTIEPLERAGHGARVRISNHDDCAPRLSDDWYKLKAADGRWYLVHVQPAVFAMGHVVGILWRPRIRVKAGKPT